jgi:hypothetical protein
MEDLQQEEKEEGMNLDFVPPFPHLLLLLLLLLLLPSFLPSCFLALLLLCILLMLQKNLAG